MAKHKLKNLYFMKPQEHNLFKKLTFKKNHWITVAKHIIHNVYRLRQEE